VKKAGIIVLAVFYFIMASGFAVHLHYCAHKLKGISFMSDNEDGCCCGSKKKSKGCCNEKTVVYRVNNSHQSVDKASVPNISLKYLPITHLVITWDIKKAVITPYTLPDSNAPPSDHPEPVYLRNRNFRI
jgi:hypothetical protein